MNEIAVTLVQTTLNWQVKAKNFEHFDNLLSKAREIGHLILLPEMFTTGFSMSPQNLWDEPEGRTLEWMRAQANKHHAAISGSVIIKENEGFYNRLYFVYPNGEYKVYDKRHLFTLAGEEKVYRAGRKQLIVEYEGWRIMPLICYDLRFPVWSRNTMDVDFMYYVANWPERRSDAWTTLLKARAIENMCYVAGVNRIGDDGNAIYHSGDSVLRDPLGNPVWKAPAGQEEVQTVTLNKSTMLAARDRFQFLTDRDGFALDF